MMEATSVILDNIRKVVGCKNVRNFYEFSVMKQETLENRMRKVSKKLSSRSKACIGAVWLLERADRLTDLETADVVFRWLNFFQKEGCSQRVIMAVWESNVENRARLVKESDRFKSGSRRVTTKLREFCEAERDVKLSTAKDVKIRPKNSYRPLEMSEQPVKAKDMSSAAYVEEIHDDASEGPVFGQPGSSVDGCGPVFNYTPNYFYNVFPMPLINPHWRESQQSRLTSRQPGGDRTSGSSPVAAADRFLHRMEAPPYNQPFNFNQFNGQPIGAYSAQSTFHSDSTAAFDQDDCPDYVDNNYHAAGPFPRTHLPARRPAPRPHPIVQTLHRKSPSSESAEPRPAALDYWCDLTQEVD